MDNINKNPELFSNKHIQNTLLTDNNYTQADNVGNQANNLNKIGVKREKIWTIIQNSRIIVFKQPHQVVLARNRTASCTIKL